MLEDLPISAAWLKPAIAVLFLTALWSWEAFHPFFERRRGRLRHAGRNLAIAAFNTVVLAMLFGAVTVMVARWAERNGVGLLH